MLLLVYSAGLKKRRTFSIGQKNDSGVFGGPGFKMKKRSGHPRLDLVESRGNIPIQSRLLLCYEYGY